MAVNRIPGVEPLGPEHDTLRFFIGIAVYILALGGLVIYMMYKLPRSGDEGGPQIDGTEPRSGQHDEPGDGSDQEQ